LNFTFDLAKQMQNFIPLRLPVKIPCGIRYIGLTSRFFPALLPISRQDHRVPGSFEPAPNHLLTSHSAKHKNRSFVLVGDKVEEESFVLSTLPLSLMTLRNHSNVDEKLRKELSFRDNFFHRIAVHL